MSGSENEMPLVNSEMDNFYVSSNFGFASEIKSQKGNKINTVNNSVKGVDLEIAKEVSVPFEM